MIADGGQEVRRSGNLEGKKIGSLEGKPFTLNSLSSNFPTLLSSSNHSGGNTSLIPPYGLKKKPAFTLAEVLITLGIIGVVAALTMPSLIANYQKKVLVAQLKKDVNFIQNSVKYILAQSGVDSFLDTEYVYSDGNTTKFDNEKFYKDFKLNKIPEYSLDEEVYAFPMTDFYAAADGSCIKVAAESSSKFSSKYLSFTIDVNCIKKPNKYGRDVFTIWLDENGNIIPMDIVGTVLSATPLTSYRLHGLCNSLEGSKKTYGPPVLGYCVYKIIEDGWEMKY